MAVGGKSIRTINVVVLLCALLMVAAAAFREVVRLDPRDANLQYNLGLTAQKLRRHEEAVEAFSRAVALKPDLGGLPPQRPQRRHGRRPPARDLEMTGEGTQAALRP
jgi:tetratricopeptide (TPR) repeat protein